MAMTKTPEEIEKLRAGGALLSKALKTAVDLVRPGITLKELNDAAEKVIRDGGGEPSFLNYQPSPSDTPFPSCVCISVNEEIVHGLGNREIELKEGDIVGMDIGCWYEGLCTDMAVTVPVGEVSEEAKKLMQVTLDSLVEGVKAAKVGNSIKDISGAIENHIKPHGYGIVRSLVGHGVGHKVHEPPHVPNFVDDRYPDVEIVDGMVLALEPMNGLGSWEVDTAEDGWSILMADGELGAHFEVTIACTKDGVEVITPCPVDDRLSGKIA